MKIYHGSKVLLKQPIVKGSNEANDYGPSFYLTIELDAAKSWACRNNSVGVVNEYEIRDSSFSKLKILDLTDKNKYSVLNWMAILIKLEITMDKGTTNLGKYTFPKIA